MIPWTVFLITTRLLWFKPKVLNKVPWLDPKVCPSSKVAFSQVICKIVRPFYSVPPQLRHTRRGCQIDRPLAKPNKNKLVFWFNIFSCSAPHEAYDYKTQQQHFEVNNSSYFY